MRSVVWFATGALLATALTLMSVHAWRADAAPGDVDSTLVPIIPCRLVDTRQPGGAALQPGEVRTIEAHGTNGIAGSQCTIPSDAVGLSMNVTALDASAPTFWTIWPDGQPQPEASSLNPAPGQPPTPNAVTTPISSSGRFKVFNFVGSVGMLIDVNGYYTRASLTELASRLSTAEATIATNTGNIALNSGNIAANSAGIATLDKREPFAATAEVSLATSLTSTPTDIVSIEMTAPVDGQITVHSQASVFHSAGTGSDIVCKILDSNEPVEAFGVGAEHVQWFERDDLANDAHMNGTRVFDVVAGTHTFDLTCKEIPDGGTVYYRSLSAIFTHAP